MHKWELGCISFQYEGNLTEVCTCKNPAVRILCPPDPLLCCSVLYTSPFYFISSFSYSKSTLITSCNDSHWKYSGFAVGSSKHGLAHLRYDVGREYLTHLKLPSLHFG